MEINLSDWASLVQDVAASLQALPPRLSNCLDPEILNLLHRLEVVTQVKFCHLCFYPETNCRHAGVPPMTPLTSWSQIMEQTLGYGMTASSGGVTTPWEVCLDWCHYPRDLHLGLISVEGTYTLAAGHKPIIQTSH